MSWAISACISAVFLESSTRVLPHELLIQPLQTQPHRLQVSLLQHVFLLICAVFGPVGGVCVELASRLAQADLPPFEQRPQTDLFT